MRRAVSNTATAGYSSPLDAWTVAMRTASASGSIQCGSSMREPSLRARSIHRAQPARLTASPR